MYLSQFWSIFRKPTFFERRRASTVSNLLYKTTESCVDHLKVLYRGLDHFPAPERNGSTLSRNALTTKTQVEIHFSTSNSPSIKNNILLYTVTNGYFLRGESSSIFPDIRRNENTMKRN
jgi:hypothetical protein